MNRTLTTILAFFFGIIINCMNVHSRPWRPDQIPNGNVNSCANCHINPQGSGPNNPFGLTVSDAFLDINGDVIWNDAIAGMDSDGDRFTNGTELQDPEGMWTIGQADPGDTNKVFNPGDADSKPELNFVSLDNIVSSVSISPNPFYINTTISYTLKQSGMLSISIINLNGEIIKASPGKYLPAENYRLNWDGKNDYGEEIPAGLYFMAFQLKGKAIIKKLYFMK